MFTEGYMALISEFVGPPHVHLNTDPLKCPHYVGGGDRNRGNTKQMPHVRKNGFLSTERISDIHFPPPPNQLRPFGHVA